MIKTHDHSRAYSAGSLGTGWLGKIRIAPTALGTGWFRIRRIAPIALSVVLLTACEDKAAIEREQSSAAEAARQAQTDSVEAVQLVTVDTIIAPSLGIHIADMKETESGLLIQDKKRGSGAVADSGKYIDVHYTTWLTDGTVLDDTRKEGKHRRILLGYGQVVKAWEEGIPGMKTGGRRLIVAPPLLGYGKAGKPGSVPRLATLVFDVEVVKVY